MIGLILGFILLSAVLIASSAFRLPCSMPAWSFQKDMVDRSNNASPTLALIEYVLDFSKVEAGKLAVKNVGSDLPPIDSYDDRYFQTPGCAKRS